jgi:hypothetical protein
MRNCFKLNSEGLGIAIGEYVLAISWQSWNKFAFAYLSGRRGFGWSQHMGFVKWKKGEVK